ncbi:unnamed protein product [[Candida] boidinii]|nr:unnamed protein product [[Candida] boidinii]
MVNPNSLSDSNSSSDKSDSKNPLLSTNQLENSNTNQLHSNNNNNNNNNNNKLTKMNEQLKDSNTQVSASSILGSGLVQTSTPVGTANKDSTSSSTTADIGNSLINNFNTASDINSENQRVKNLSSPRSSIDVSVTQQNLFSSPFDIQSSIWNKDSINSQQQQQLQQQQQQQQQDPNSMPTFDQNQLNSTASQNMLSSPINSSNISQVLNWEQNLNYPTIF